MAQRVQTFQEAFNSIQKQLSDISQQLPVSNQQSQMIVQAVAVEDDSVVSDTNTTCAYPTTPTGTGTGQWDIVTSQVTIGSYYFQQWGWGLFAWS